MHACGHDVHTAIALGVAHVLRELRGELTGRVKFIFQPAEETLTRRARDDRRRRARRPGDGRDPRLSQLAAVTAGTGRLQRGRGDGVVGRVRHHAQGPRRPRARIRITRWTRSSAAAHLVTQLQTIVSREMEPTSPAVLTVGQIAGRHGAQHHRRPR